MAGFVLTLAAPLEDPCMTGPAWLRRIRQPRPGCCRYHHIDWRALSQIAISIAQQAQASGTPPEDAADAVDPAAYGLDDNHAEVLAELLRPETGIEINEDDPHDRIIQEGRHRITAMRDAGIRRTVTLRSELIEASGDPG